MVPVVRVNSHGRVLEVANMKKTGTWAGGALIVMGILVLCGAVAQAKPGDSSASTARIAKGRTLAVKMGCGNCHITEGSGGAIGPPLDGIAAFCDRDYIVKKLTQKVPLPPSSYPVPEQLMQHVHVAPGDASLLTDYLLSLKKTALASKEHEALDDDAAPQGSQFVPLPKSESTRQGAEIFARSGCMTCHAIGPIGGRSAPNLAGVGARRSRRFIEHRILHGAIVLPEPGKAGGKVAMPPQQICEHHLKELADFLLSLPPQGK